MIKALTLSLKAILDDSSLPVLVRDAEVAFDRPGDTYSPDKDTINLFLYDVREKAELRSSEPIIARQDGVATIRQPPIRLACSYLVTAWIGSGVIGEQALLRRSISCWERFCGCLPACRSSRTDTCRVR